MTFRKPLAAARTGALAQGAYKGAALGAAIGAVLALSSGLAGCAGDGPSGRFAPPPGPIVTDPPGALDDLGWLPYSLLLFADRDRDGVLNAAEQRRVREAVIARDRCEDTGWCF